MNKDIEQAVAELKAAHRIEQTLWKKLQRTRGLAQVAAANDKEEDAARLTEAADAILYDSWSPSVNNVKEKGRAMFALLGFDKDESEGLLK